MASVSKPRSNTKTAATQCVAVGVILLAAWALWRHGQPEPLLDLTTAPAYDLLSGGVLYRRAYRDAKLRRGPMILGGPVEGGAERTVVTEDDGSSFYEGKTLGCTKGILRYGLIPYKKPPAYIEPASPVVSGGGSSGTGSGTFLGAFAPAGSGRSGPGRVPELHVAGPAVPVTTELVRIREAPAQGGAGRDAGAARCSGAILVGDKLFWTRAIPHAAITVTRGNETWLEISPSGDLMLTDLALGTSRPLRRIAPRFLAPCAGGVVWTESRPFPDRQVDVYYASAQDGAVVMLGPAERRGAPSSAVELDGSVYWFSAVAGSGTGCLMSADLKGPSRGPACPLSRPGATPTRGLALGVYRGQLFCVVQDAAQGQPAASANIRLARFLPGRPNGLETLCSLSANAHRFQFDRGYLYYAAYGTDAGLVGRLTDDGVGSRLTETLYRVPLR
jgi:hypothetical protein